MIAQHRHQYLVPKTLFDRIPVNVKERGVAARSAIFENIPPEAILSPQRHVIRHDIQHLAEGRLAQRPAEPLMRLLPAQLRVHPLMIHHVVPVHTPRRCLQVRRAIDMRDPQIVQVRRNRRGVVESEPLVKL